MRKTFILFFVLFFSAVCTIYAEDDYIDAVQASSHVNENVRICGKVADVFQSRKSMILNINAKYPNEDIGFMIWHEYIPEFSQTLGSLQRLRNKRVCATGLIERYKRHLYIKLRDPKDLHIEEE